MVIKIVLFFVVYVVAFFIGWWIPEKMVSPWGLFDVYPWKCRKCLTTWMMVALYIGIGLMVNWWFIIFGLIISGAQAYCFIYTDKEKGL